MVGVRGNASRTQGIDLQKWAWSTVKVGTYLYHDDFDLEARSWLCSPCTFHIETLTCSFHALKCTSTSALESSPYQCHTLNVIRLAWNGECEKSFHIESIQHFVCLTNSPSWNSIRANGSGRS